MWQKCQPYPLAFHTHWLECSPHCEWTGTELCPFSTHGTWDRVKSFTRKPEHLKVLETFNMMMVKFPVVFQWLLTHHLVIILLFTNWANIHIIYYRIFILRSVGRYFRTLQQVSIVFSVLLSSLITQENMLNSLQSVLLPKHPKKSVSILKSHYSLVVLILQSHHVTLSCIAWWRPSFHFQ